MKAEERLQAALEQPQMGRELGAEEAELLALAGQLRAMEIPPRDPVVVAQQRAALPRAQTSRGGMTMREKLSQWGVPLALAGGAVAVMLTFGLLVALVIGGGLWWRARTAEAPPLPLAATEAPAMAERPVTTSVPGVKGSNPLEAHEARMQQARGEVEVLATDGRWIPALAGTDLIAGQRVRTGDLAAATLRFADGSEARLGAQTEIEVLAVTGEPRVIVLEQVTGQTLHLVQPDSAPGARYAVQTPAGVGEALGTIFGVAVSAEGQARFSVDEGQVAVTGAGVTVQVQAGEVSTVIEGNSPAEPVFRISGEGELTATGDVWTIGGQDFVVTADTLISGEPQLGDWVAVDGRLLADDTRVADAIWVANPLTPTHRFEFSGVVESSGAAAWVISGVEIAVDAETEIEADIAVGDSVQVEGLILEDGSWLATEIKLEEDATGGSFEFTGVLESTDPWIVDGRELGVDAETEIQEDLVVGDLVKVEGVITEDGVWLATEIKRSEPTDEDEWAGPGLGGRMVTLCHKPDGANPHTITVASPAVAAHLAHGDTRGACAETQPPAAAPITRPVAPPVAPPAGEEMVTICHSPNSRNPQTLTIPRSALQGHLGHGDTMGACP